MNRIQFYDYRHTLGVEIVVGRQLKHSFCTHTHRHFGVGIVEQGRRMLQIGETRRTVQAGQMFWLAPGEAHGCEAAEPHDYQLLLLEPCLLQRILTNPDYGGAQRVFADAACFAGLQRLATVLCAAEPAEEKSAQLIEAIGAALDAAGIFACSRPEPDEATAISALKQRIEAAYPQALSIDELAQAVHLSPYYAIRRFRETVGITPHMYLQQLRIRRAKEMLNDGWRILDAALAAGFHDQSHFCNVFKRLMGVSPGSYAKSVAAAKDTTT